MKDHSELSKADEKPYVGKKLLRNMVDETLLLYFSYDIGGKVPCSGTLVDALEDS